MNIFLAILFSILLPFCNYLIYKTFQLCGYNTKNFVDTVFSKGLASGNKNKLVLTKRMLRLIILHMLICASLLFCSYLLLFDARLKLLNTVVIYLFSPVLLMLAHIIILPIELLIKQTYIKRAKSKLKKKNPKIIGITGSFGKTSTKNILASILEKSFKVCKTPLNYNTEMGLTKTILEKLDDEDFLIAEMGARHKGDIKKLCEIACPDYVIITSVGEQHLETFGSLQTIEETKSEIITFSQKNAPIFINCDTLSSNRIYEKCKKNKFATCRFQTYAYATDINYNSEGSAFTLNIEGHKVKCKTLLLGRCNIDNIVTASALAYYLGVSLEDIVSAIKKLEPTAHRLELIQNNTVCVLDDAYNSNLVGAKEALNVLSTFKGRKIVVTPGFVEMGKEESTTNFKLGTMIADVADYVIVMNELNKNYILSGLISHNFDNEKIFFATTREEQKELLTKLTCENAVILFENDLPDNYK